MTRDLSARSIQQTLADVCAAAAGHPKDRVTRIEMTPEVLTVTSLTDVGERTDTVRWADLDRQIAAAKEERDK